MFKKLTLQNWKSFRYAELPIDSLTILIGTNASGKSNVVDAFEFLKRKIKGENINSILRGNSGVNPIRGGIENISHKNSNDFSLQLLMSDSSQTVEFEYNITVLLKKSLVDFSENKKLFNMGLDGIMTENPFPLLNFQEIQDFLTKEEVLDSGSVSLDNLAKVILESDPEKVKSLRKSSGRLKQWTEIAGKANYGWDEIFTLSAEIKDIGSYSPISNYLNSDGSNLAGFIASLEPDRKTQLENKLTEYLNHLPELEISKVWVETVGRLNSDAMIYCEEKWGNSGEPVILDARSMSDGTLRFLTIMTAILTRPAGSQLIIEEIDNGLHPSRAKFLIELLRDIGADRQVDVLITTHNSALLDALEPDMMPFVIVAHRDQETGESKLTPLDELEDLPKLLASGSLGNLVTRGAIERSISRQTSA